MPRLLAGGIQVPFRMASLTMRLWRLRRIRDRNTIAAETPSSNMSVARKVYRYNDADEFRLPPSFPDPAPRLSLLLLVVLVPWSLDVELNGSVHVDEAVKGGTDVDVDGDAKTGPPVPPGEEDMVGQKQEV